MEFRIKTQVLFNQIKKIIKLSSINPLNSNQEILNFSILPDKINFYFLNDKIQLFFELISQIDSVIVTKTGNFFINLKLLHELLSKIKDEWICFEKKFNNLIINNLNLENSFILKLNLIEFDNFPTFEIVPVNAEKFILPKNSLKRIVNQVGFAIDVKNNIEFLCGINFKFEKDNVLITGADNTFLAQKKIKILNPKNLKKEIIIPLFLLNDLEKLIGDVNQEIVFFVNDKHYIVINCGSFWVKGPLIAEKYSNEIQNWNLNFLNKTNLNVIKINDFINFLNVIDLSVILSKKDKATAIELFFEKETARVEIICTSNNNAIGKIKEYYSNITVESLETNLSVIFYYSILMQVLKSFIECNNVIFNIDPKNKRTIITSDDDNTLSQLLLPCVKINS